MDKKVWAIIIVLLAVFGGGYYFHGYTANVIKSDELQSYMQPICHNGQCIDVYVECTNEGVVVTPRTFESYTLIDITGINISNKLRC